MADYLSYKCTSDQPLKTLTSDSCTEAKSKIHISYEEHEDDLSLSESSGCHKDLPELRSDCNKNSDDISREGEEDEPSDDKCDETKAPDGGYGWFVVLGCFIAHVVFGGLDRSEGVFFLFLTSQFGQNALLTSWPGAAVTTFQFLLGPLANVLTSHYSARLSVMLGAALMFLGFILSSFAPNLYLYFFCHGLIDGIGRGMAYVPGLVIVGMYFNKRAGLAAGFATSGSGIGTFIIVPLSQYLADNYGFQGTFLILGGFACHMFVAAMLYRPLSVHVRSKHAITKNKRKYTVDSKRLVDKDEKRKLDVRGEITTEHAAGEDVLSTENMNVSPLELESLSLSSNGKTHQRRPNEKQENCLAVSFKVCFPTEGNNKHSKKLLSFYLLKNPSFLMYCVSIFTLTMAFRSAFTFIPALVESKGISKSEAALALSAAGAVDTFGRIGTGFLLDLPRLRPFRLMLYNLIIFGVALVAFLLPSLSTFAMFCVMCSLYGLLTGAYISQKSVVLADILDCQDVASSFGILMMFQGMGNLLGPPLSGALTDLFGSFDESFYFGGGLLVLAGLVMVLCNIFNFVQKRERACRK